MNKISIIQRVLYAFIVILSLASCERFLEEKSDKKLVVPNTLEDLQALLDNASFINSGYSYDSEISADDYYYPDDIYTILPENTQRMYRWEPDMLYQSTINSWHSTYKAIYIANNVLETLSSTQRTETNGSAYDYIKGQALVIRGSRFLDAAATWCLAYDSETSVSDLGLPLRLDPDFNAVSVRASVKDTYTQVLEDLHASIPLLQVTNINSYRATKPFAYALLARTYLYMRNYEQAAVYADSCLQLKSELLNFNELDPSIPFPIPDMNEELIFHAVAASIVLSNNYAKIPSELYESYETEDLRKNILFTHDENTQTIKFRGGFTGSDYNISAPSTSEVWLIYAEASVRTGQLATAREALNYLLESRYVTGKFSPITENDQTELLDIILQERRKELVMRGARWMDVKRLNKEGRNIILTRSIAGTTYTLPPNDPRFAVAIPDDVIAFSGMQQNPR